MTHPRHLVVIGAQRCGSTFLLKLLSQHPAVCTAEPARPEPKVFIDAERTARGHEWYDETWFSHAEGHQLLVEKSTSYLENPEAPARVLQMLGEETLALAQLRDPIDRAVSNWRFSTDNGLETRPLVEAIEADLEAAEQANAAAVDKGWDRAAVSVSPYAYVRRGHYVDYLEPWRELFGERLVLCLLDETAAGGEPVVRLFRSLGLNASAIDTNPAEPVNASTAPGGDLDADLVARLRDHYADSDARLAELLGRPLPWRQS